jgi:hypothetical protein
MKPVARFVTRPSEDPMTSDTKPDMGFIFFTGSNTAIKPNRVYEIQDYGNGTLIVRDVGESGIGLTESHPKLGQISWLYTISHIFAYLGHLMVLTRKELDDL